MLLRQGRFDSRISTRYVGLRWHVQLLEFEWDDENAEHIARHGVDLGEAEEVFFGSHLIQRGPSGRRLAWGRTSVGRHLLVVFTVRGGRVARVVTARDMSAREKRRFRRRLGR